MNGIIILLGAPNDAAGNLSSIAVERCRRTVLEYRFTPRYAVLPTGGFGKHFNRTALPHAFYTRRWLLEYGVPEKAILEPVYSRFTEEDARLSKPVVVSCGVRHVRVVTSDFHVARARLIFNDEFAGYQLRFSASETELPQRELAQLIEHEKTAVARIKRKSELR
ncbi:MAG: hypothetical protein AVDCRST_MAG86-3869 [uncultured Truepera sp.]|uniref:DUF218 domain-containing protein n=1 Tax=uncultured Truepera sp. TaxID=543023 RepID=A0A6J4VV30_9DEIN|nr:MAG: hypothetical protein AVDCRST_MAG86-3869 [uncultured Truepera sp.]